MGRIHVWEKIEIVLKAENRYDNPYMDVDVGVVLTGPAFKKRVYGFWDGENVFKVRVLAVMPGTWVWESFSNVDDPGLRGKTGSFEAVEWSEKEKEKNLTRRGFIRPSPTGHAFVLADGTPFFWLADMWLASATQYYPFREDDREYPIGPEMGFKDMIRFRKAQGFNGITIIAGFPNWAIDRLAAHAENEEGVTLRSSWAEHGNLLETNRRKTRSKDMFNEGGRPFHFPGCVPGYEDIIPDMTRINPEYFRYLDKRLDYCNENGMIPFLEIVRRDTCLAWYRYCGWPETYIRYIAYTFARYHANNMLLSPIHMDHLEPLSPRVFNEAINTYRAKYGDPPFGTLVSTNANPSTLVNFGNEDWITFHQIGNRWREHVNYWYVKEQYFNTPVKPALNGEPYTPGFPPGTEIDMFSEEAAWNCRSGMYGSVLNGGQAGFVHELEVMYDGANTEKAILKMWDVFDIRTSYEAVHLKTFIMSLGGRHQELIPESECIIPNKQGSEFGWTGWAYCAYTPERDIFMIYFERGCTEDKEGRLLRNGKYGGRYKAVWFNPRTGEWLDNKEYLEVDIRGVAKLPAIPDEQDWALKLTLDYTGGR